MRSVRRNAGNNPTRNVGSTLTACSLICLRAGLFAVFYVRGARLGALEGTEVALVAVD